MKRIISKKEIPNIAHEILDGFAKRKHASACVCALSGDLGAGKTTLTQEIARTLGVVEHVSSPTFVIMKLYPLTENKYGFKKLIHIDAYRLSGSKELFNLGWEGIVSNPDNLILVEWPEYVPECVPDTAHMVRIVHKDEDTREISID